MSNKIGEVKKTLDTVSPSFCLAKWLQVTVHLQNGQTHSCHHPGTHKIPLKEIQDDPSSLHNTSKKKLYRKEMLEGKRPSECDYCWTIEDAHPDNISDRILKSSHDMDMLEKVSKMPWDAPINPRYLEVSFGNECNFRCAYCAPHISSALMAEYREHGNYATMPAFKLDTLKEEGLYPYEKNDHNPYVEAFWKWWPSAKNELQVFRITGGEPLINNNTFRFLDFLIEHPMPHLEFAINSNLGIPDSTYEKFLTKIQYILENKLVKKFSLFTSVDGHGKNAEFIRFGMNYSTLMKNVKTFLERVPEAELNFMCTYNVFSVVNFDKFLIDLTELKKNFRTENGFNRVHLDTPYLKNPRFLSCYTLTPEFLPFIRRDLDYIRELTVQDEKTYSIFSDEEFSKFERIYNWFNSLEENKHRMNTRRALFIFLVEYQKRKGIQFHEYCPEYKDFLSYCKFALLDSK